MYGNTTYEFYSVCNEYALHLSVDFSHAIVANQSMFNLEESRNPLLKILCNPFHNIIRSMLLTIRREQFDFPIWETQIRRNPRQFWLSS